MEEEGGASWPARPSSARGARRAARRGAALEPTPKAGASPARGRGELGRLGHTQVVGRVMVERHVHEGLAEELAHIGARPARGGQLLYRKGEGRG